MFSSDHTLRADVRLMSPSDLSASKFLEFESMRLPGQRKCFHVAEILDGFDNALLNAEATVFNAAERRVLDAKTGNFVDVNRATLELAHRAQCEFEIVRHNARTQSIFRAVGNSDRVVED